MRTNDPAMARIFEYTKLDPTALALAINTSPQNISNWSKRGISKQGAIDISKKFDLSVDWIFTGYGEPRKFSHDGIMPKRNNIEIQTKYSDISKVHEGIEQQRITSGLGLVAILSWNAEASQSGAEPCYQDPTQYAPKPHNLSAQGFALTVRGQCMLPEFKPDELIYVEPMIDPLLLKDSDLIIVHCNGDLELIFQQLVIGSMSSDMYLKALNPDWLESKMRSMADCRLVGKVVGKYVEY